MLWFVNAESGPVSASASLSTAYFLITSIVT
jgi:hypothetical protein